MLSVYGTYEAISDCPKHYGSTGHTQTSIGGNRNIRYGVEELNAEYSNSSEVVVYSQLSD